MLAWSTHSTPYSTCNGKDRLSSVGSPFSREVRSSCIMGELEDAVTEEVELKRERKIRFHYRHADRLGFGVTLTTIVGFLLVALLVNASDERIDVGVIVQWTTFWRH